MVDWNEMIVFVKVVDQGSFVGAARALGLPKSTVSRKVARLEDRLGVRLLNRTTRVVRTTSVGQAYYDRCSPLVNAAEEADRLATSRQERPTGQLRLTTSVLLAQRYFGPVIMKFLAENPDVNIHLLVTNRMVDLVDEGYDLAIRAGRLPDAEVIARRLGPASMVCVASPAYLKARGRPREVSDLSDHACIIMGEDGRQASWNVLGERVSVKGPLTVNDMEVCRDAALSGLGVAFVPAFTVFEQLRDGELERVFPEAPDTGAGIFVVYPSRRHVSTAVRAFIDFAVDEVSASPPWLVEGVDRS